MLLLTARKSDLEYRAQQITNSLMILAQQTEEVAREYSVKISNQTIVFQGIDRNQTTTNFTAKTISGITAVDGAYNVEVRVPEYDPVTKEPTGKYIWKPWTFLNQNGQKEKVDLNGNNGFVTTYYTDDDKEAEAEYNTKTASIQVKEKRLQNDLNQVQTQQKACDTEIDSVKKIMDKNIERTFKVFS